MFDTILIGTSGLLSHAKGLRVVGNNLANVNTPGFKSSQLVFTDLFNQSSGSQTDRQGQSGSSGFGTGLSTLGSQINFKAGLDAATGNPLDVAIDGNGFYAVEREGRILYTRAGDFSFNEKGILVTTAGEHVKALDAGGKLADVTVDNLARSAPKATSTLVFRGNLSTTVATPPVNPSISSTKVLDADGVNHPLTITFKRDAAAGAFNVTVADAAGAVLTTGSIKFAAGFPVADANSLSFQLAPAGVTPFSVKLDFSKDVTSLAEPDSISVASQDGYAAGVRSDQRIDASGLVQVFYSNGQKADGQRLALANFQSEADLEQVAGSAFAPKDGAQIEYGHAGEGTFGKLVPGHREGSNVDLAEEFGNLILMQRGYQASSHVISTANDMIQQLFDMKGR